MTVVLYNVLQSYNSIAMNGGSITIKEVNNVYILLNFLISAKRIFKNRLFRPVLE